jgi:hypothetical protein
MVNGGPGRGLLIVGGVGGIIWLVGVILAIIQIVAVSNVGAIILGIGVLLTSLAGVGVWQRARDPMAILMFIFAMIGGILMMAGGAVNFVSEWGVTIFAIGQALFAISLIILGLVINKSAAQLSTQAKLGMDLVFPAVATSMAGGCAALGAAVTVTAPAAFILALMFFTAS